jgi:hypothetical protein
MTLRQRYEKRLWSLILENESAASEANTETPKVKLGKIAQKIKDSGLETTIGGAISKIEELISSMKDLTDPESMAEKEHDILRSIKAKFLAELKKKYADILQQMQDSGPGHKSPNFMQINASVLGLTEKKDGKEVYRDYASKSLEIVEKIKENFLNTAKDFSTHRDNLGELEKDFDDIIKPWIEYLESSGGPTPDIVDAVIDTFEKKINAIVKAYGVWLTENKEAISEIMKALQDNDSGDKPRSQTAGYRRLGNTLFERFLMSGGLK